MVANTESVILQRVMEPVCNRLVPEVASFFLTWDFPPDDQARMDDLMEKARAGTLTADEDRELEGYIQVGQFLAFVQSKARQSLANVNVG